MNIEEEEELCDVHRELDAARNQFRKKQGRSQRKPDPKQRKEDTPKHTLSEPQQDKGDLSGHPTGESHGMAQLRGKVGKIPQ